MGCVAMFAADGTPCDDGEDTCTTPDACVAGFCVGTPVADGTPCNDGLSCTSGDQCIAGACASGVATDCSALDDPCNVGTCQEPAGTCAAMAMPDGTVCDDGEPTCTINDMCMSGVCTVTTVADGTFCDDGDPVCTPTQDTCLGGSCLGTQVCVPPLLISQSHGGSPDFIEIMNTSAAPVDLGGITLEWELCGINDSYTFSSGTLISAGGVYRLVELSSCMGPNEDCFGANLCDNPASAGWIMLCDGNNCNTGACNNILDYFEKGSSVTPAAGCVSFTPNPVVNTAKSSTESLHRVGFAGSGTSGVASDWAIGPMTRL